MVRVVSPAEDGVGVVSVALITSTGPSFCSANGAVSDGLWGSEIGIVIDKEQFRVDACSKPTAVHAVDPGGVLCLVVERDRSLVAERTVIVRQRANPCLGVVLGSGTAVLKGRKHSECPLVFKRTHYLKHIWEFGEKMSIVPVSGF